MVVIALVMAIVFYANDTTKFTQEIVELFLLAIGIEIIMLSVAYLYLLTHRKRYVYLSYSDGTQNEASQIIKYCRSNKQEVLSRDLVPTGSKYMDVIAPYISKCNIAYVLVSSELDSLQKSEIKVMRQKGIRIVPIIIDGNDIPQSLEEWKPIFYSTFLSKSQSSGQPESK